MQVNRFKELTGLELLVLLNSLKVDNTNDIITARLINEVTDEIVKRSME